MSLARFAFQACSFNHSYISPFRINDLRAVGNSVAQNPPSQSCGPRIPLRIQQFAGERKRTIARIVIDLLICFDHLRRYLPASCCVNHQRRTATADQIASTTPNG